MTKPIIQVEHLSKQYRLGAMRSMDRTFRELIHDGLGHAMRRIRHAASNGPDRREPANLFNALDDVSFEMHEGEVLGVIGNNGAGKSTLLKILSRITDPTSGRAVIRGRVGSLLEVGTGFHPELTGRENIYLNGSILGMRKREIDRNFDAIVDFSGVEKFLDTPVKRYSSGMTVRLAFAVAAHLNPRILIVDEVLAVGDAAFQEKCLGKMQEVAAGDGRTVLFVSHNMPAVAALCSRAILLEHGKLKLMGEATHVVDQYLNRLREKCGGAFHSKGPFSGPARISHASIHDGKGQHTDQLSMTDPIVLRISLDIRETTNLTLSIQLCETNQNPVVHFHSTDSQFKLPTQPGRYEIEITLPALHLYPAEYLLTLTLSDAACQTYKLLQQAGPLTLTINQDPQLVTRVLNRRAGLIFQTCDWRQVSTQPLPQTVAA